MVNCVKIFRMSGVCTMSRMSLKSIINMVPEDDFLRIHRSYIVAKSKITGFSKRHIQMEQDVELPVGRLYMDNVKDLFASLLQISKKGIHAAETCGDVCSFAE